MMPLRRASLAVVPLGVLASHALAYRLGDHHGHEGHSVVGHAHLAYVAALSVPVAVAGLVAAARAGYRGRTLRPHMLAMAGLQTGAFVTMEGVEHATGGGDLAAFAGQPTLWWGLAVQLVVAWAVAMLLRTSAAIGSRLRPPAQRWPRPAPTFRLYRSWLGRAHPAPTPTSRRGPP